MLLAAIFFASSRVSDTRLAQGTAWTAKESLHYVNKEAEIDETHRFKIDYVVAGQEGKLWVVERKSYLQSSKIGGQELGAPTTTYPDITKEWLSADGYLVDNDPFDRGVFNIERLTTFWLPEGLPDTWAVELNTALRHFTASSRAEFKLVSGTRDTTRTYSLTFKPTVVEDSTTATGQLRFDVKTGRLLEANISAKNAFVPGGTDKADITITYTSQAVKSKA